MNDLESYFFDGEHRLMTKWNHYFEIYDRYLSRYRGTSVNMMEIGVFHGGSLQMWRHYFGPAADIYGVDIDPKAKQFEEERTHVIVGDQGDERFLRVMAAELPQIDVVIDDGGHTMRQQKTTLAVMLPLLASDGVYICEDLHTSYWSEYGGGYRRKTSLVEHAKTLVDSLNAWHSRTRRLNVTEFTTSVYGMHFYDSVLVIEKRPIDPPQAVTTGVAQFEPANPTLAGRFYNWCPDPMKPTLDAARPAYYRARRHVREFPARFRRS